VEVGTVLKIPELKRGDKGIMNKPMPIGYGDLTAVAIDSKVLWVVTPLFRLKAVCYAVTSLDSYRTIRRYSPEYRVFTASTGFASLSNWRIMEICRILYGVDCRCLFVFMFSSIKSSKENWLYGFVISSSDIKYQAVRNEILGRSI
jgi:hypothetical protein